MASDAPRVTKLIRDGRSKLLLAACLASPGVGALIAPPAVPPPAARAATEAPILEERVERQGPAHLVRKVHVDGGKALRFTIASPTPARHAAIATYADFADTSKEGRSSLGFGVRVSTRGSTQETISAPNDWTWVGGLQMSQGRPRATERRRRRAEPGAASWRRARSLDQPWLLIVLALAAAAAAWFMGQMRERQRRLAAEQELQSARSLLAQVEARLTLYELQSRLLGLISSLEARNYGEAQPKARAFFDAVRDEAGRSDQATVRAALEQILADRDRVMIALTQTDPAALETVRGALGRLRAALGEPALRPHAEPATAQSPDEPPSPSPATS